MNMTTIARRFRLLMLVLLGAAHASAADPAMAPGLKVGDRAPAFTLTDSNGSEVALTALLAKGSVALVFHRSADWCPFCIRQLNDLQARLNDITATGIQLVAISYDSPETLKAAAEKHGFTFPLLSDEGSRTIDAFGIRNTAATRGRGVGIPHPMVFVIDQQGVIRAKLNREGYRERPEVDEIIAAANALRAGR